MTIVVVLTVAAVGYWIVLRGLRKEKQVTDTVLEMFSKK